MINFVWAVTALFSAIYTISYAIYELKNHKFISGIASCTLALAGIILSIIRLLN